MVKVSADSVLDQLMELAELKIAEVIENINDPNTDATKERVLTLKVRFKPDSQRTGMSIKVEPSVAIAPMSARATQGWITRTAGGVLEFTTLANPSQERLELELDGVVSPNITAIRGGKVG